jgi:hypothetical protein
MSETNSDIFTIDNPKYLKDEYFESLLQCSIISGLIYEDDPIKALESHQ